MCIPVLGDIKFVADTPVPWNDERPAFSLVFVYGPIEDVIQRGDQFLQAAAILRIN